ncbi:MAG TPA: IS200/IS605 family transposase, partial [Chthoniobacteraceae bacterium]
MSSTHHALIYHFIFGTKHQEPTIRRDWRDRLHAFLGGCVNTLGGVPIIVGGVSDHVHLLVSLDPSHVIKDVLRDVKRKSSEWIHTDLSERGFGWQDGYGAFTVSIAQRETVRSYIARQEEHHRIQSFRNEYVEFLERHQI